MSGPTAIPWADAVWNPTRGCWPAGAGCLHCYAARFATWLSGPGRPFDGLAKGGKWTGAVRIVENAIGWPLTKREALTIFVDSMSDLFYDRIPEETIDQVLAVIAMSPHHSFVILTKRTRRMREYMGSRETRLRIAQQMALRMTGVKPDYVPQHLRPRWPPDNLYLGVSCSTQPEMDELCSELLETSAAYRVLSLEPLVGPVDLDHHQLLCPDWRVKLTIGTYLDGVIVGGESGPRARPCHEEWLRKVVRQCQWSRVPVFVKQYGANPVVIARECGRDGPTAGTEEPGTPLLLSRSGSDPREWPADLRVRELPWKMRR